MHRIRIAIGMLVATLAVSRAALAAPLVPLYEIHHGITGQPIPVDHNYNRFGQSVAGLGYDAEAGVQRYVVGAPYQEDAQWNPQNFGWDITTDAGVAYLYESDGTLVKTIRHPFVAESNRFGEGITGIGTEHVAIAAPGRTLNRWVAGPNNSLVLTPQPSAGIVYLFDRNGTYQKAFQNPNNTMYEYFGQVIRGLGPNTFAVGVPQYSQPVSGNGRAYVYDLNGLLFTLENPHTQSSQARFGCALTGLEVRDQNGNLDPAASRVVVGAYGDDQLGMDAGRVYVFDFNGNLQFELVPQELGDGIPKANERFGAALAVVDEQWIAVGAPYADIPAGTYDQNGNPEILVRGGRVYLFSLTGAFVGTIENPDPAPQSLFGAALVGLAEDRVVIGAPYADHGIQPVSASGRAYVMTLDDERLHTVENPLPSPTEAFGLVLGAMGPEEFVVGSPLEDSAPNAVDATPNAGSVYGFRAPIEFYPIGFEIPQPIGESGFNPLAVPPTGPAIQSPEGAEVYWRPEPSGSSLAGRLYATQPGKLTITWPQSNGLSFVVQGVIDWPADPGLYQHHVADAPPTDLNPSNQFPDVELLGHDPTVQVDLEELGSEHFATSHDSYGRSLLLLATGPNPQQDDAFFQLVETSPWSDPAHLDTNVPAPIGDAVMETAYHDPAAGGPYVVHEVAPYLSAATLRDGEPVFSDYYGRSTRTGPIIPVNVDRTPNDLGDDLVVVYYQPGARLLDADGLLTGSGVYWPWKPVHYAPFWDPDDTLVIADNNKPPIDPVAFADWEIYYQNDANDPGFNPNDEHAMRYGDAIYPLRSDLGTPATSEPFVLMTYTDPQDGDTPKVKVFEVVAEDAVHTFDYTGTAGQIVQAPAPLEHAAFAQFLLRDPVSGADHYWKDVKDILWAKSGGNDGGDSVITARYHYPHQPGNFYLPAGYTLDPDGLVPWLDLRPGNQGLAQLITYEISWPAQPTTMQISQTVRQPYGDLPDLSVLTRGVEIIYQQSVANTGLQTAHLIDPTRIRSIPLPEGLPDDIANPITHGGKTYFGDLPPHLRSRLAFNQTNNSLEYWGVPVEPELGDPFVVLNVLTERDANDHLYDLSEDSLWPTHVYALKQAAGEAIVVANAQEDVDSYALTTGFAQGHGWITVVTGNDILDPSPNVQMAVLYVENELFTGDLYPILPDDPFDERITIRHKGDFAGRTDQFEFEWRVSDQFPAPTNSGEYLQFATDAGMNDVTLEGSGKAVLADSYWICRYRPLNPNHPFHNTWSEWTGSQFAPGWIKRVLGDINPFTQRISSGGLKSADDRFSAFADQTVNTVVDMISQAGPRWTGAIPFNAEVVNGYGLIEIYETVLRRGIDISISGTPPEDYGPANLALMLAAGRLADLYMLLGNEAYADAADPTIAFGTDDGVYGAQASSLHCFMNQTESLLAEELALLRGRDDGQAPPVDTAPVYNRLVWNFTDDIVGGEVAYALNYNLRDVNGDVNGSINEADAKALYPQGHGDAWGHYLTAIKNYYRLLSDPYFTWQRRAEDVLVGGVGVTVDYYDERKFAQAAAAKARTGAEVVNLTYRGAYVEDPAGQYQGYRDADTDRAWGVRGWACRAGQGAYFDWAMANAMLPDVDPDPNHTGIQKIDRTTVTDLREIVAQFEVIQEQIDRANIGLNPLGLAKNVVPFDIDPALVAQGKPHFEQVYDRAATAMNNAVAVFNHANNATQLLRRQADTVADFQQSVEDQEADFDNRLIELCGYPYANDIGPGATYPQGYLGPDTKHYMMIDPAEVLGIDVTDIQPITLNVRSLDVGPAGQINEVLEPVTYHVSAQFGIVKPASWTGSRLAPGEVQIVRSSLLQTWYQFLQAKQNYDNLIAQIQDKADYIATLYDVQADQIHILNQAKSEVEGLHKKIKSAKDMQKFLELNAKIAEMLGKAAIEGFPKVNGFANDVTSPGRAAAQGVAAGTVEMIKREANSFAEKQQKYLDAKELVPFAANIEIAKQQHILEVQTHLSLLEQLVRSEATLRLEVFTMAETLRQACGKYAASLSRVERLLDERTRFRQYTAGQIQGYRYKDMAFRIFRNDALQKYRAQFDLAARYVFLAANAYDYETNLQDGDPRGPGPEFMTDIIRSRSLGMMQSGLPMTGPAQGDPGLADPLARMSQNWNLVLKGQLGFNNPQTETGRFSLRSELFRVQPGYYGNETWRETLRAHVVPNLFDLPEFNRYCVPFQPHLAQEPGIVIPFASTINFGQNFFGRPLGGADNDYDSTHFATKIRSVGVWFSNYNNLGGGMVNTPRVYLVPAGLDIMRSPSQDYGKTREWRIVDQALPVPFPLSQGSLNNPGWIPAHDTLLGDLAEIRRYPRFRAYHDSGNFNPAETVGDSRLIGRSVWNTRWMLIIPAGTLHSDRQEGLNRFIEGALLPSSADERDGNGISDIKLFFQTYAYSGN